jgi:hypothetical protein
MDTSFQGMNVLQIGLTCMQFKVLPMSPNMCYLCVKSIHSRKERETRAILSQRERGITATVLAGVFASAVKVNLDLFAVEQGGGGFFELGVVF